MYIEANEDNLKYLDLAKDENGDVRLDPEVPKHGCGIYLFIIGAILFILTLLGHFNIIGNG